MDRDLVADPAPLTLALDLEGVLISNAVSQIPRPGLFSFLTYCQQRFERLVIFTTVKEPLFRRIASTLVAEGAAPTWFSEIEYVGWEGKTKDLNVIPGASARAAILVDDYRGYVHPGQEDRWFQIEQFDYSGSHQDVALDVLRQRLDAALSPDSRFMTHGYGGEN